MTKLQKRIIRDLQNGYQLITDSEVHGAWVANKEKDYHIGNKTFFNLLEI